MRIPAADMLSALQRVLPSAYSWLIPKAIDSSLIDTLAKDGLFPKLYDLYPAVFYAVFFGICRYSLQIVLFKPLAIYAMDLQFSKMTKSGRVPEIDAWISIQRDIKELPMSQVVRDLSQISNISERHVKRYIWNKRRDHICNNKVVKFSEAMWRAMFYGAFTILGFFTLFRPTTASWVISTRNHWVDWPYHEISLLMGIYYHAELGCYLHQLYWTEVSRSDALEMIIHHIITILLILLSYLTNFTRIGCSILLVHDFADVFLEVGKCFNYTSKNPLHKKWAGPTTDTIFALFALSFFITRLLLYPQLVYSLVVEAPDVMGMWDGYWIFAVLLLGLQGLHVFWFYLIVRMIRRVLLSGGVEKDVRSDDEGDGEAEFMSDAYEGPSSAENSPFSRKGGDRSSSASSPVQCARQRQRQEQQQGQGQDVSEDARESVDQPSPARRSSRKEADQQRQRQHTKQR